MIVERTFTVFAIRDSQRNTWLGVVNELTDMVQVYGLNGEFYGEARHLLGWCEGNGYKCIVTKRMISVEIPE